MMASSSNTVALVRCRDSVRQTLEEGLSLIGGFGVLESPVVIKPNICTVSDSTGYSVTRLETVKALIDLLLKTDENLSIRVVESDSESKDAADAFRKFGYTDLCEEMQGAGFDVDTVDLSRVPSLGLQFVGDYFKRPELPEIVLNAGYFISMAIPKTHHLTFVTGALKNLFGVLPRKDQSFYHSDIDKVIVDLARIIRPRLSIIDARVGMEGWNGPKTRRLDAFILGHGAVSVDATMARVMGFGPEQVRHIMEASVYDLGTIHPAIIGESIESIATKFKPPK